MKKIVRMAALSAMFFSLLTSCEKELGGGNDNTANKGGNGGDLVSMVNELKEEVAKLSVEVSGLKEENSALKEEIKALKPEGAAKAIFEVDGLFFSKDGRVASPLKKSTFLSKSDGSGTPSENVYKYDNRGRIISRTHYFGSKPEYEESYVYEGSKLTTHYAYKSALTHHDETAIYEY